MSDHYSTEAELQEMRDGLNLTSTLRQQIQSLAATVAELQASNLELRALNVAGHTLGDWQERAKEIERLRAACNVALNVLACDPPQLYDVRHVQIGIDALKNALGGSK